VLIVKYILVVLEVATSLLLIGVILLQKTKAHGAGMVFGAEMGESLFGAQAGNVLTKITIVLTTIFLVNTAILSLIGGHSANTGTGSVTDSVPVRAQPMQPRMPSANTPASGPAMPAAMPAATPLSIPDSAMPAPGSVVGSGEAVVPTAANTAPTPTPDKATAEKPAQK
jgi:preprotein translocase subunit SecG